MRILVTFAVEVEFAPWRQLRKFSKSSELTAIYPNATSSFTSKVNNDRIEILLTGIGRESCESIFSRNQISTIAKPDIVISSGLAGALKEKFHPGDLIVARKTRTLRNDANVDSDPLYLKKAAEAGAIPIDTLITVDRIVPTVEEKARLAFFGEAVEMESAIILDHFVKSGIPVLALRGISDTAGEDLPIDFDRCLTPQGAIKPMNLINQIVRRPGNLPNLVRFGRQSNQAAQTLAQFLDSFVEGLIVAVPGTVVR